MKRMILMNAIYCLALSLVLSGCGKVRGESEANSDTGPHPAAVEPDVNADNFKVEQPERFPLATAGEYMAAPQLNVTGVVSPDVSRQMPVPSLASGRVLEIHGRLGGQGEQGHLLFK